MEKFNIDKVENIQNILDTASGLVDTINDLVDSETLLFTDYPGTDKGKSFRANRLYSQLLALSLAANDTIEQAEAKLNSVVTSYYKGGAK